MTDARTAYREASARGVSPVRSVVQLYEQIIEDLRLALGAIEQNQIELRTNKINHAILVIGHLQSRLNFQSGGKVAQNLDRLYDVLRRELLQAQFQVSAEILSGRINDLLEVRAAWLEVERAVNPAATRPVEAVAAAPATSHPAPARAN